MLDCTVSRLSSYNQEELAQLDDCLIRLGSLLEKFAAAGIHPAGIFLSYKSMKAAGTGTRTHVGIRVRERRERRAGGDRFRSGRD